MRILDSAQVSAKITGIRQSAKSIRENVQATCIALVGHALKYGNSPLATRLVSAVSPQDRKLVGAWLEEYGPFAYDRSDNTVQFSKAKRAKIGASSDAEIEALLDTLDNDAAPWFEAKTKKAAELPERFDVVEAVEAAVKKMTKRIADLAGDDVPIEHAALLDEINRVVLAYKRKAADLEDKVDTTVAGHTLGAMLGRAPAETVLHFTPAA